LFNKNGNCYLRVGLSRQEVKKKYAFLVAIFYIFI
jgi:hypothetical protein